MALLCALILVKQRKEDLLEIPFRRHILKYLDCSLLYAMLMNLKFVSPCIIIQFK